MDGGTSRRALLAGFGGGLAGFAGCTSSDGSPGAQSAPAGDESPSGNSTESTTTTPGSYCDTASLTEVTVAAESPESVREALDAEFVLVLSAEKTQLAIVNGLSARDAADQVQASNLELRAVASLSRCLDVTCDVRSKVQFPKAESGTEADVMAAFPDAVKAVEVTTTSGGRFWSVYSTAGSRDEIESRLEDGGFDAEAATIRIFDSCERYDD